ncbi:MAG: M48 family metalloprotease [Phycisphaerae bacterium]
MKRTARWTKWMPAMMVAIMSISTLTAGGCGGMLISREQEIAMGREAAPKFTEEFGGELKDVALQDYVTTVGKTVAAKSDREMPYTFTIVRSDVPNAFALPGGPIFLTAGLMARMENERELAAVLGHEVAHIANRHNVKQLEKQMGAMLLIEVAKIAVGEENAGATEQVGKLVTNMALLKYSRKDEYQADADGLVYMEKANYNPWGMVELLRTLKELSGKGSDLTEMFQTHPLPENRIDKAVAAVKDEYESYQLSSPDPDAQRFQRMRRRLLNHMNWKDPR